MRLRFWFEFFGRLRLCLGALAHRYLGTISSGGEGGGGGGGGASCACVRERDHNMRGSRTRRAQRTASCVESPDTEVAGQNGKTPHSDRQSEVAVETQGEGDVSEAPEEAMPQQQAWPKDSSASKATNKKRSSDAVTTAAKRKKQNAGSSSIPNNGAASSAKAKKKRVVAESEGEAEAELDLDASSSKPTNPEEDEMSAPPSSASDESAARNRAGKGSTKRKGAPRQKVSRRGSSRARAPVNYVPEAMDGDEVCRWWLPCAGSSVGG